MNEVQATSGPELVRLRQLSAQVYGDVLLFEAVRLLHERAGAAIDELRKDLRQILTEVPDHEPEDDRPARRAFEELERAAQLGTRGESDLALDRRAAALRTRCGKPSLSSVHP